MKGLRTGRLDHPAEDVENALGACGCCRSLRCGTAVGWADVVAGPERAQGNPHWFFTHPFLNQLPNQSDKSRMRTHRARADHGKLQVFTQLFCLGVEVVEDLHMVGDKADRRDDDAGGEVSLLDFPEVVKHVGLEPGLGGRTAAALEYQAVSRSAECRRYQAAHFFQLGYVAAALGHGERNTVRGVDHTRALTGVIGKVVECSTNALHRGFDESGMVVERAQLVDLRSTRPRLSLRSRDVLAILPASGVGTVGRRDKGKGVADTVALHL